MEATITHEHVLERVTSITVTNPRSGLQVTIILSKDGIIINPGVPVEVERWDGLAWQIVPAVPEGCGAED